MGTYYGGNNNDSHTGTNSADTILGNGGNDSLWGMGGNDSMGGGDGHDMVAGGAGNDSIWGNTGNDSLFGDVGQDVIYGGDGDDLIRGGPDDSDGGDLLYGGSGNDSMTDGAGNDTVHGDEGNDELIGGTGNDTLYGGADDDSLWGGIGDDVLEGDAGNDQLVAGAGSDLVLGGLGDDTLYGGGGGSDTLTGGDENDLFDLFGGSGDSIFLSDFGAGETNGANDTSTDNDYVDLTPWYNPSTLAAYNAQYGTSFTNPLQALAHDAADNQLQFIAFQGGPTVTFTLIGSGVMDTEHTGVLCFARGTMIETDRGSAAIEELQCGDRVKTLDHGFQPIRWIGSRRISAAELAANPKLRPIRIRAGALGRGLPEADVVVSPQHRVLVSSRIAERMFGAREILVAARQLLPVEGIDQVYEFDSVDYFHFLFDRHQIVFAEGAPMESLFTGIEALKEVSAEARREIFEIMPDLMRLSAETLPDPARPLIQNGRIARKLAARHARNGMPLTAERIEGDLR